MLLLLFFTLLKGKLLTICPGKLIQKIVQIFSSPDHEPDRITGKLIHANFMSTYSVFVIFMSRTVLLENSFMSP